MPAAFVLRGTVVHDAESSEEARGQALNVCSFDNADAFGQESPVGGRDPLAHRDRHESGGASNPPTLECVSPVLL